MIRGSEILNQVLSPAGLSVLSGPSIAYEVARGVPTTVVAASPKPEIARQVQEIFSFDNFRVYTSRDVVGVELGGALKNVIVIAAGICDGLGLGVNAKGAILSRGLREITRLGTAMGADPLTFAGLSGMGDLVTTAFSLHSRNRWVGEQLGRGRPLSQILSSMVMVAEGVPTTRAAVELARAHKVEMPITQGVYEVCFEGLSPREGMRRLMERSLKPEVW
jgi:glycerol-3-phosphate dehydrogenase (NAD(P)+)